MSCRKDQEDFLRTHRESIEKTMGFIEDFKRRNGAFPNSRQCHDWIIRQNLHEDAGITVLNVRFSEREKKPISFDIFDGEEWVCIYNLNSQRVEKKLEFSSYSFSFE